MKLAAVTGKIHSFLKKKKPKTGKSIKPKVKQKSGISSVYSIRVQLVAAFLVMIIPISALGFISQKLATDALEQKAIESAAQTMEQTGNYLNLMFQMVEDVYMQILASQDVRSYIQGNNSIGNIGDITGSNTYEEFQKTQKAQQILTNMVTSSQFLSKIVILKNSKSSIGSTALNLNEKVDSIKETPWYKAAENNKGSLLWIGNHQEVDQFMSNEHDKKYSISAIAVMSNFLGNADRLLLVIDIKLDFIEELLSGLHLGKDSEIHLISPDGRDISSLKQKEVDKNVPDITEQEFYKNIQNSEEPKGTQIVSYRGQDYLSVYEKIGDHGYVLMGLMPRLELLKTATTIRYWTLALVIFAILVALGTGFYMAMGMGKTINSIIDVADSAASGDLTLNPVSRRRDELGLLTHSIAKMTSNMRELIQQVLDISQKVASSAGTVASTSQQVSATSHEISSAIQKISRGASEQAGDAEQGSKKMEQLAGKINIVSDNAKSIHSVSQNTADLVRQGLTSVEELDKKSHQTTAITKAILADIHQLEQQSKSIDTITKVINGIVGQTKLLALNAAIEAARAGEAGRGFAVVADEVRKLAEQSMEATREITSIIKATQQQTAQTVERAQTADETIKSQNQSVVTTISIFKEISSSMESLAANVDQVISEIVEMEEDKNEAVLIMHNVSSVSQQTAASSEEITASSEEQLSGIEELAAFAEALNDAAQQLTQSITRFKI